MMPVTYTCQHKTLPLVFYKCELAINNSVIHVFRIFSSGLVVCTVAPFFFFVALSEGKVDNI